MAAKPAAAAPNPAVSSILAGTTAPPATPITPISSAPSAAAGLSMHPEAVRARARRAKKHEPAGPTPFRPVARAAAPPLEFRPAPGDGPRYTPAAAQEIAAAAPPPPAAGPTPAQIENAVKNVALVLRGLGLGASWWLRFEEMRVPKDDSLEVAQLLVEGYPELALEWGGDAKKGLALGAVGSLVFERFGKYSRREEQPAARAIASPAAAAAEPTAFGAMQPMSIGI